MYGRVPPFAETISYVRRAKNSYEKSKTDPGAKTAAPPVANAKTATPNMKAVVPPGPKDISSLPGPKVTSSPGTKDISSLLDPLRPQ
jgi:hypothetical protein